MGEFRMPSLGADMEAGTIVEWRVKEGDPVNRGDIVAVVDTDKADIDVEIFESGIVAELLVPVGERVPVGTPLASIVSVAAPAVHAPPPPLRPLPQGPLLVETEQPAGVPTSLVTCASNAHSPVLRRLAKHLGVDIEAVHGTGPGGRVLRDDIEAVAAGRPAPAPPVAETLEAVAPTRREAQRRAIAALMSRSKREIPHYYVATQIDMSTALDWLQDVNAHRPVTARVLPAAVLLRAVALTAHAVPELNGFWTDGRFLPASGVHLGVAVSLREGGLVAPAIHDADRLDLDTLMASLRDLVQRARAGRLRSSEMADPSLTVTNLGDQGVEVVHGVIYPPQVALVGLGRIVERPWAEAGMVGVRPILTATLAADHRATDGHLGARFLSTLDRQLHHPEEL
jgi:pyruvate dehydrogenase E2 component (dihydrolipoamide acetyltransferase)